MEYSPLRRRRSRKEEELDLPGQRQVVDCMIDQGVDGICILANYSEQFLLTDVERNTLLDVCLDHVAGRVPVIVTCSHFSTRIAAERARQAEAAGAAVVMMMPPYHGTGLRADEAAICEHFSEVAECDNYPNYGSGRSAERCRSFGGPSCTACDCIASGGLF